MCKRGVAGRAAPGAWIPRLRSGWREE